MMPLGWALIQCDWCPYKSMKFGQKRQQKHACVQRKDHVRTVKRGPSESQREKSQEKTNLLTP